MAKHPSWDFYQEQKYKKCSPTALRSKNDLRPQRDAAGWYFLAGCQGFVCSHWIGLRPAGSRNLKSGRGGQRVCKRWLRFIVLSECKNQWFIQQYPIRALRSLPVTKCTVQVPCVLVKGPL